MLASLLPLDAGLADAKPAADPRLAESVRRLRWVYTVVSATVIVVCVVAPLAVDSEAGWVALGAPLGMTGRYLLAKWNQPARLWYRGTLAANVLGTGILVLFVVLRTHTAADPSTL